MVVEKRKEKVGFGAITFERVKSNWAARSLRSCRVLLFLKEGKSGLG